MVAGGEFEAAEELRLMSGRGSGDAPATRVGAPGSSGDGELSGVLHDGEAAKTAAELEVLPAATKTLISRLRRL